jgi:hypothetical protein
MEIGYPQVAQSNTGNALIVINQEIVCEDCLANFDALYAMAQLDTKGVHH